MLVQDPQFTIAEAVRGPSALAAALATPAVLTRKWETQSANEKLWLPRHAHEFGNVSSIEAARLLGTFRIAHAIALLGRRRAYFAGQRSPSELQLTSVRANAAINPAGWGSPSAEISTRAMFMGMPPRKKISSQVMA